MREISGSFSPLAPGLNLPIRHGVNCVLETVVIYKIRWSCVFSTILNIVFLLEENAWANPDARIRPLTHVSVDRAYQAKSVGSNSLVIILIAIRRYPNL